MRETREEVGLEVDVDELVPFAVWTPPQGAPKPLTTTFFAVRVPDGELVLAPDEVVAAEWVRPGDALDRHAAGAMPLWPPTWVTLHGFTHATSVDEALADLGRGDVHRLRARRDEASHGALAGGRRVRPRAHRQEDHPAVADEGPTPRAPRTDS